MRKNRNLIIYCDGGSRGNPGPAASAFVVTKNDNIVFSKGIFLNIRTNNFAEYTAVILGLDWLSENETNEDVVFNLDSQLIERQINGFYKIKSPLLKPLFDEVKMKILKLKCNVKFIWNYRSDNKLADELVNKTLDTMTRNAVASTGK